MPTTSHCVGSSARRLATSALCLGTGLIGLAGAAGVIGVVGSGGAAQAAGPTATPAISTTDSAPVKPAIGWLEGQLSHGLIHNNQYDFDDYGLSVDTALGLHAVGRDAAVATISTALAPHVADYYSYPTGVGDDVHVSAGSLAKALVLAQSARTDPTTYGGHDLVAELQDRVSTAASSPGRIGDRFYPAHRDKTDYANVIGQAFAVHGLSAAASTRAADVTTYLLGQQCADGYFPLDLSADTASSCGAAASDADVTPSVDATALSVIELEAQASTDPSVTAAIDRAVSWLKRVQGADGSFTDGTSSGPTAGAANANSTGLAGWAMGDENATAAAARAATWVRAHQAADAKVCGSKLAADNGAIAFDSAALATGRAHGITVDAQDQFRRATAQALPALRFVPAAPGHRAIAVVHGPTGSFLRAAAASRVSVSDLAPGRTVCFTGQSGAKTAYRAAGADGSATDAAKRTAGRTGTAYRVAVRYDGGDRVLRSYTLLARATLSVQAPDRAAVGSHPHIEVDHGLVAGEPVRVIYRGETIFTGHASRKARFGHRVAIGTKAGPGRLIVRGAFADRGGRRHLVVTG